MRRRYRIVGLPVVDVGARFVMPCRFDDEVVVESEVGEWGRSSFTVRHRILKAGELALDGFEKRVWAAPHPDRPGAIKAQAIPAEIIASLSDATGAISFLNVGDTDLPAANAACVRDVVAEVAFPGGPAATWKHRISF